MDIVDEVKYAARALKEHKVIAFPTETVMGLGVIYNDLDAYKLLGIVKNREPDKPYSLMLDNINDISKYAEVDGDVQKVIDKFLPGPLTLLLKAKSSLPNWCYKDGVVGIRVPNYKIIQDIISLAGSPILAPSANKSGEKPANNSDEVKQAFKNDDLGFIVSGKALGELASTILDMSSKPYKIIRQGIITKDELAKYIKFDNEK